jgi:transcription-repair coupling factor (superfamily II helicase)
MTKPWEATIPAATGPLPGGAEAAWALEHLLADPGGPVLFVTPTEESAGLLADDLAALGRERNPDAPTAVLFSEDDEERLAALSDWTAGRSRALVAPRDALDGRCPPPAVFTAAHRVLRRGDRLDRDAFFAHALAHGYERVDTVERPGEVAVRGEVLDLWAPGAEGPVRALWPFDQIESLRKIDLTTQRSTDLLDEVRVGPARLADGDAGLLDYLGPAGLLFESRPAADRPLAWAGRRVVHDPLATSGADRFAPAPPVAGRMDFLAKEIRGWLNDGWTVRVFCHNAGEQERLEELLLLEDRGLAADFESRRIDLPLGPLTRGFLDQREKRAVLAHGELFGRARRRLRLPKFVGGAALQGVAELRKGDYVVHERFGIGRYVALEHKNAGGTESDYLRLEYKGGDRVFVPLFEFRQVRKFIGTEGKRPVLSSLDTAAWDRSKAQVEAAVAEMARELLARAAARQRAPGFAFPPDTHLEQEFGASFLYDLTPDQARAIEETKRDMTRPLPMDRLVCGDVGYGKTEVALRAAFKAVCAGKQVAVLVPTTILAEQHGRNFRDRFADYPVSVAVLSRFSKPAEQKRIALDIRRGVVDVAVGTHRLLSPDVAFKDLGLVIIDEEHRFGVKQKERIKAFRDTVDVLALSATPIPRTLGSALGGLKGLSVIESPPEGRLPIATHVGPFDPKIVAAAVEQELRRGGQVFYVHNRVGSIEKRRQWLTDALRDHGLTARIALAHGQMTGPAMEKVMWDFLHRQFDILIATSIIESGLDIPTVNTLIVEEAEDFGLAQLYQLRGRVGRERQKAYCFLFHSPDAALSEEAQKRLAALKEFAALGAGFKLAMRDLEIRGAGNLLGPQQHGFVNAVGLDLYGQLLSEEIEKQKSGGAAVPPPVNDPALDLPVSAYLPPEFMPSEADRVLFYKRLLDAAPGDIDALAAELADRCGRPPEPARRLFDVARLRHAARAKNVTHILLENGALEFRFAPGARLPPEWIPRLIAAHGERFRFLPPADGLGAGLRFEEPLPADLPVWCREFLDALPLDTRPEKG